MRAGFAVANAKTVAFDVNIRVENHTRRSIHLDDELVPVKYDRGYAHLWRMRRFHARTQRRLFRSNAG